MRDIGDDPIQHVKLAIRTPRGTWPTEGFMEVQLRWGIGVFPARKVGTCRLRRDGSSGW
jgi:hypothetical protein